MRILDLIFPVRIVRVIDVVNAGVAAVILTAMAWQFWLYAIKSMRAGEITWMLSVPKAPFWFAVDGMFWIAVLVQLSLLTEEIRLLKARA